MTRVVGERLDGEDKAYTIVDTKYNGFEFASDAYAYLAKLQEEKKVV